MLRQKFSLLFISSLMTSTVCLSAPPQEKVPNTFKATASGAITGPWKPGNGNVDKAIHGAYQSAEIAYQEIQKKEARSISKSPAHEAAKEKLEAASIGLWAVGGVEYLKRDTPLGLLGALRDAKKYGSTEGAEHSAKIRAWAMANLTRPGDNYGTVREKAKFPSSVPNYPPQAAVQWARYVLGAGSAPQKVAPAPPAIASLGFQPVKVVSNAPAVQKPATKLVPIINDLGREEYVPQWTWDNPRIHQIKPSDPRHPGHDAWKAEDDAYWKARNDQLKAEWNAQPATQTPSYIPSYGNSSSSGSGYTRPLNASEQNANEWRNNYEYQKHLDVKINNKRQ